MLKFSLKLFLTGLLLYVLSISYFQITLGLGNNINLEHKYPNLETIIEDVINSHNGSILSIEVIENKAGLVIYLFRVLTDDSEVKHISVPSNPRAC